jgi:hypothetical protein
VAGEDRPYWEQHYGIVRGPTSKARWKKLGKFWLAATLGLFALLALAILFAQLR